MKKAVAEDPSNPKGYCNLAAFQANAGKADDAVQTVEAGLKVAPGDSCLLARKTQVGVSMGEKALQTGDFAAAAQPYEKMLAANPQDAGSALRLGQLYFDQGTKLNESAEKETDPAKKQSLAADSKTAFVKSSKNFSLYHSLKPDDKDGLYNNTLAALEAGDGATAAKLAEEGLTVDASSSEYHGFLASAYTALNVPTAASAHKLVSRTLKEGQKVSDPAGFAQKEATTFGATSVVAKKLKELGPPEDVRTMTIGDYPVETWLWPAKKRAIVFSKGALVTEADWNAVAVAQQAPAPAPAAKKKTH
jgi:Tfp pilus assembly protein PilF